MKSTTLLFALLLANPLFRLVFASPLCGGDISYAYVGGLTYNFTVTIMVCESVDSLYIDLQYGDGTQESLSAAVETMAAGVHIATFTAQHVYPAATTYIVQVEEPNLLAGICNVPNSVEVPLRLATSLTISPFFDANVTPSLSPIYEVYEEDGYFIHDLQAVDSDGDSLSFELLSPSSSGFSIPEGLEITTEGQIRYLPTQICPILVAVRIVEWRNGNAFQSVIRTVLLDATSVAIEEAARIGGLVLFPNPSTGPFTLSWQATSTEQYSLMLYDVQGRAVHTHSGQATAGHNAVQLELSHLPAGIYFGRLAAGDGARSFKWVRE